MTRRTLDYAAGVLIALLLISVLPHDRMLYAKNDFAHFYIGGLLYGSPGIHDPEVNFAKQQELIGGKLENSFFGRPTFYGFLLKPLSWLPYLQAYAVFQALSLASFCVFVFLNRRRFPMLPILSLMSVPLLANLTNGQDVTFLLLFSSVALVLVSKRSDIPAGLLLSLCAIKAHLFVLVPLSAILWRRWRIVAGGAIGGMVLMLVSLAGGGIEVQKRLMAEMQKPEHSPYADAMPNLRSLAPNHPHVFLGLAITAAALAAYAMWKARTFEAAFAWALTGGPLISVHAYAQDCLLLLFALALLHDSLSKVTRNLFYAAVMPMIYVLLLMGAPYSGVMPLTLLLCLATHALALIRRTQTGSTSAQPFPDTQAA
jgi:hypothetical protein